MDPTSGEQLSNKPFMNEKNESAPKRKGTKKYEQGTGSGREELNSLMANICSLLPIPSCLEVHLNGRGKYVDVSGLVKRSVFVFVV